MRPRTLGRQLALQYLYMLDVGGAAGAESARDFVEVHSDREDVRVFACALVAGVQSRQTDIDAVLGRVTENWDLARVAPVERNILRLGCGELFSRETPPKVVMDEAVELAKRFGGRESGSFVNGILDRVGRTLAEEIR